MIIIGIDPGYHIGIAIFFREKLKELRTLPDKGFGDFRQWFRWFGHNYDISDLCVIIECSYLNPARFRPAQDRSAHGIRTADATAARIVGYLEGYGDAYLDAQEGCALANHMQIHEIPPPLRGGRLSKVSPVIFQQLFPEYTGRSSEHSRDAALHARDWMLKNKIKEGL